MKNQISKHKSATFCFCSMSAIITGLNIETFTTTHLQSIVVSATLISVSVLVITLTGLIRVFLNLKNVQQKKIVFIKIFDQKLLK